MRRKKKEKTRKTKKRNTRARRFKNYLVLFVGKGRRPNALRGPGARARARARALSTQRKSTLRVKIQLDY